MYAKDFTSRDYKKRDSANLVRLFGSWGSFIVFIGSAYFAYRTVEIHERRIEALETWRYDHSIQDAEIDTKFGDLLARYNASERATRLYRYGR